MTMSGLLGFLHLSLLASFLLSLDTDECASNTHNCHISATCSNTVGSFTCSCNDGYTGDGTSCNGMQLSPFL